MLKYILPLFLLLPLIGFSQTDTTYEYNGVVYKIEEQADNRFIVTEEQDTIYMFTEVMPEFPGGMSKLFQMIGSTLKYPNFAKDNDIAGKVYMSFVITKEGNVTNIKIVKGVHASLDKEAMRVVKLIPNNWTPGRVNGSPVNGNFLLPINFALR
jgi:periplasmic protein TonB